MIRKMENRTRKLINSASKPSKINESKKTESSTANRDVLTIQKAELTVDKPKSKKLTSNNSVKFGSFKRTLPLLQPDAHESKKTKRGIENRDKSTERKEKSSPYFEPEAGLSVDKPKSKKILSDNSGKVGLCKRTLPLLVPDAHESKKTKRCNENRVESTKEKSSPCFEPESKQLKRHKIDESKKTKSCTANRDVSTKQKAELSYYKSKSKKLTSDNSGKAGLLKRKLPLLEPDAHESKKTKRVTENRDKSTKKKSSPYFEQFERKQLKSTSNKKSAAATVCHNPKKRFHRDGSKDEKTSVDKQKKQKSAKKSDAIMAQLKNKQKTPSFIRQTKAIKEDRIDNSNQLTYKRLYRQNNIVTEVSSDESSGTENEIDHPENETSISRKRKRNRKLLMSSWPREITKSNREQGNDYEGYEKKMGCKVEHGILRHKRILGERCESKYCKKSTKRNCKKMLEVDRENLFKHFWNDMKWDQKKIYIASLVEKKKVRTRYVEVEDSRRSFSMKYFLYIDGERQQVCKAFFLSSFGLKEWMVRHWVINSNDGIIPAKSILNARRKEKRPPSNKSLTDMEKRRFLINFFDELPKMPSHYCRQRTDKKYIEPNFQSWAQVYRYYKLVCEEANNEPLSIGYFSELFKDLKLGLYQPKKDRCDTCEGYDKKQVSDEEYNLHILQKRRAQKEKKADKKMAKAGKVHAFVGDVEAVKLSPVNKAGLLYYKTKLKNHNFSIYNLRSKGCCNYWWHEGEGDMDASMFATCIIKHFNEKCNDSLPIILWTDGCCYQNRNQILSNALLDYSMKTNKIVQQKYLVKGHTQMEVDNVHYLIEKKLKNRDINLPSDYVTVTKEARLSSPLEAISLNHTDFKNFDDPRLFRYNSIRPGSKAGDPTVQDLRVLNYSPNGVIGYKTNFDDDLKDLPRKVKTPSLSYDRIKSLYAEPPQISAKKYNDLQQLKAVLDSEFHTFYDNLSHESMSLK